MRSISELVTNKQARTSALLVGCVLLLIGAWNLYRQRPTAVAVLGCISIGLIFIGLFWPSAARRFHVAWMKLAGILGYINSRILLFLLFYLLITPYGLISRLFGRDPLTRRGGSNESYWIARKTSRQRREQFERSF